FSLSYTASTQLHTLSLHDALPILKSFSPSARGCSRPKGPARFGPIRSCMMAATLRSPQVAYMATPSDPSRMTVMRISFCRINPRSEEHTSELQSRENLVCRLLLEK